MTEVVVSNLALWIVSAAALAQPRHPRDPEGSQPLESEAVDAVDAPNTTGLPQDGATPLARGHLPEVYGAALRKESRPLGEGPPTVTPPALDPAKARMLRLDLLVGPVWRSRTTDMVLSSSAEYGQMRGFSGSVHTAIIVATTSSTFFGDAAVRAVDFPLGVGGLYRGRLKARGLYGSVGVTAGILVHRAAIDTDLVQFRVDPDFRVPLRLAWTIADFGMSLGCVAGYSVRRRSYERRGTTLWARNAFRVGLVLGLHWDGVVSRDATRKK